MSGGEAECHGPRAHGEPANSFASLWLGRWPVHRTPSILSCREECQACLPGVPHACEKLGDDPPPLLPSVGDRSGDHSIPILLVDAVGWAVEKGWVGNSAGQATFGRSGSLAARGMDFGDIEGARVEIHDAEQARSCLISHAKIERLWTGARWSEGPAWFPAHRCLVWSDIPNDRQLRFDETSGQVSVFRQPCGNSNGNSVDAQGRLISCEHLLRRVTRTEHSGRITVLADVFEGRRLNSPNDVAVHRDGSIWFTDPMYGILSSYEGEAADSELERCHVFRLDPETEVLSAAADDFVQPNGLAFSPDQRVLYVSDTGGTHETRGPRHIRRCELSADGRRILRSDVIAECSDGFFDGLRCDAAGRIWTSAGRGVDVLTDRGDLIARIRIPELVPNVAFGGRKRNRLFICGTTSLYAVFTATHGAAPP